MIDPLYGGQTAHDVFQTLLNEPMLSAYEAVRETQKTNIKGDFEDRLAQGAARRLDRGHGVRSARRSAGHGGPSIPKVPAPTPKDSLEIIFRPDPNIYDGRWSNVGWLQELPKPVTSLSWDNAAHRERRNAGQTATSKKTTSSRSCVGNGTVKAPVIVAPGHPDNSVTVYLGYGREFAGRVGSGAGFNAYLIRNTWAPFYATGAMQQGGRQVGHRDHQEPLPGSSRRDPWLAAGQAATTRSKPMRRWDRAASSATPRSTSSRPIRISPTRARAHETPSHDTSLFPNWAYNEATRGACRST